MEILALVPNLLGFTPGQRSTIEAWEPSLKRSGINVTFSPFETEMLHEVLYQPGRYGRKAVHMLRAYERQLRAALTEAAGYDAVFVYREAALVGPAFLERLVVRRKVPLIYELDDPLHVPYRSRFSGPLSYLKFFGKVPRICKMSTVVIVNSEPLKRFVQQHNSNVWEIPSVVDSDRYIYVPKDFQGRSLRIGWSGSPTTAPNVSMITNALREVQQQTACEIDLIGSGSFNLPGLRYSAKEWNPDTEVEDLRRLDVGLVPVPENPWNEWKFFMKVAQYMALGIPPVATPRGTIRRDIDHGRNGFIAENEQDWVRHLTQLDTDRDLLQEMSRGAAKTASERFTVQANEEKIIGAFRSALR